MAYTGNTYPCCRVLVTFPTVDTVTVNLFEVCFVEEEKKHKSRVQLKKLIRFEKHLIKAYESKRGPSLVMRVASKPGRFSFSKVINECNWFW